MPTIQPSIASTLTNIVTASLRPARWTVTDSKYSAGAGAVCALVLMLMVVTLSREFDFNIRTSTQLHACCLRQCTSAQGVRETGGLGLAVRGGQVQRVRAGVVEGRPVTDGDEHRLHPGLCA